MLRRLTAFVLLLAVALTASGCFDVDTEVKVLPDGSGFVTVWVRMTTRLAAIGTAARGSSLAAEKVALLRRLDEIFYEREGVRLVDRNIVEEADSQVLRYRYSFDDAAALNRFWADAENAKQDVTISGAKLNLVRTGADCGASFDATVSFAPRPLEQILEIGTAVFGKQTPETKAQLAEEYYKGRFRLRLVLPGQTAGADADQVDTAGRPIWQKSLYELLRTGLVAKAASRLDCDGNTARPAAADESFPAPAETISDGPRPTMAEVLEALNGLGDLVTMEIRADVDKKSSLRLTYRIDSRVDQPVQNLLLALLAPLPTLAEDWEWQSSRDKDGFLRLTLRTKKPLRLDQTGSGFLFAGRDGNHFTFRLKLPPLVLARAARGPDDPGPVMVKVRVKMPRRIAQANATFVEGQSARWVLTQRDLVEPVVLEAISEP